MKSYLLIPLSDGEIYFDLIDHLKTTSSWPFESWCSVEEAASTH